MLLNSDNPLNINIGTNNSDSFTLTNTSIFIQELALIGHCGLIVLLILFLVCKCVLFLKCVAFSCLVINTDLILTKYAYFYKLALEIKEY